MSKNPTLKQLKFVSEYISNGGNKVQAALKIYDTSSYKTASKIADDNFKSAVVRDRLEQLLSKNNLGAETIAKLLDDGLHARLMAYNSANKSYHESDFPDFNTNHKYLEILIDLLGLRRGKN
ncbi:MAG: terminase small subunit [Patescibacteria group bacterium]